MKEIDFFDLETRETPREILESDFPSLGKLPIKGGWGYNQGTACVIDKNDPTVDPGMAFDGVSIEYVFAEYRIYEELIVFRPKGRQYAGIRHRILNQKLLGLDGRRYDKLTFEIQAFREEDFERLKLIYEGPDGVRSPSFDASGHEELHNSLLHIGVREYWFDITSFFGNGT